MRIDGTNRLQSYNGQGPNPALENAGRIIQGVAQNDFGGASRLAGNNNKTVQDTGKVIQDAGQLIEAAGRFINDAANASASANIGQFLMDAGGMLISAANLINDLNGLLSGQGDYGDARQWYQDGQQHLRNAGQTLSDAGSNGRIDDASSQAAEHTREAGQCVCRAMQATERGAHPRRGTSRPPRFTSQIMREHIHRRMREHCNEPQHPKPQPSPAPMPEPEPAPEPAPPDEDPRSALKAKLNQFIEQGVDNLFFDKLGLQRNYAGGSSSAGEWTKAYGSGITPEEVKNYLFGGASGYGTEGKTLAELGIGTTFGQIDRSAEGNWGSAFVTGSTAAGVRGRVFGDLSLQDRRAYIGAEGEAGLHATYNAGYSSPRALIAGQEVGLDAGVTADVFAGAAARGKIDVSLQGNEPHVAVGGEVFAGARASIQGGIGASINGRQVAEIHGKAEGWAGLGARAHLDAGFSHGKLNFDLGLGAALGIGGSVDWGFSVDVGSISKGIAHGVENVVDKAVDNIEELGHDVGKTADKVATEVGHTIEHAAQDAGKAIGKFFKKIF